jgi:hypothetical protein
MSDPSTNNAASAEPSFSADPAVFLDAIASSAPSSLLLSQLAGPVATSMKESSENIALTVAIAPMYLRAVAQQLPAAAFSTAPAAAAAAGALSAKIDVEAEMKRVKQIYEIAEVRLPFYFASLLTVSFVSGYPAKLVWNTIVNRRHILTHWPLLLS